MNTLTLAPSPKVGRSSRTLGIALLGCGTVGRSLVSLLHGNGRLPASRTAKQLRLRKALVRDLASDRGLPPSTLTDDFDVALNEPDVDVIVELIGGIEPARSWIMQALAAGKHVVTANKALLAEHGQELFALAGEHGVSIGISASVCGAVPILGAISEGMSGNRIERLCGIVNGTCNYILTRMTEGGVSFDTALREAQAAGFAEADPSLDVGGEDAAQKLSVLAGLAFGAAARPADVWTEGIRHLAPEDIREAARLGYVIKHLAIGDTTALSAQPWLLPVAHPLARVRGEQNAVMLHGDASGAILFQGAGAGGMPTAGSVLSDLAAIARGSLPAPTPVPQGSWSSQGGCVTEFYLRLPIVDVPGAIGLIATALGNRGVSIRHARAELVPAEPRNGNLYIQTHECRREALQLALDHIANLPVVREKPTAIPVYDEAAACRSSFIPGRKGHLPLARECYDV